MEIEEIIKQKYPTHKEDGTLLCYNSARVEALNWFIKEYHNPQSSRIQELEKDSKILEDMNLTNVKRWLTYRKENTELEKHNKHLNETIVKVNNDLIEALKRVEELENRYNKAFFCQHKLVLDCKEQCFKCRDINNQ